MGEKRARQGGGCIGRLSVLFVLVLLAAFGVGLFFVAQPQDVTDISGYGMVTVADRGRNLTKVLQNAIERGHPLTLGEAELNGYLKRTRNAKQGGLLSQWVSIEGVAVRLEEEVAEVVIERRVAGRTFTVSMFLSIDQTESADGKIMTYINRHGGRYHESVARLHRGGRFGQVVVPQGFLVLVLNSFERIAGQYGTELDLAFKQMSRIRIEKNKLVLDPRLQADGMGTTF